MSTFTENIRHAPTYSYHLLDVNSACEMEAASDWPYRYRIRHLHHNRYVSVQVFHRLLNTGDEWVQDTKFGRVILVDEETVEIQLTTPLSYRPRHPVTGEVLVVIIG